MNETPEPFDAEPTLGQRLARHLARVAWRNSLFFVAALLVTIGLAKTGVGSHEVIRGMVLASPVLLAGLLSFVAHAWRQNTHVGGGGERVDAEPVEPGQVGQVGQPEVARPVGQVEVTATVLNLPSRASRSHAAGQLPRAVGADHPTVAINPEWVAWEEGHRGDDQ